MKAIKCLKYGGSENLVLADVEKPLPKNNEVMIKIKATSVTASDVLIRRLHEVFAYGSISTTNHRFGSYAEYICLPEDWSIALKPANLSHNEAAAPPYGGLLAMHLLSKTSIQKGDEVLIYGASGSIGTMAVQLAKIAGANVTAVCSGKNFDLVKSLGSDRVIDYTLQGTEKQLSTYKYVLDAVGNSKSSILKEKSKKALNVNGKYISIDTGVPKTPRSAFIQLKNYLAAGKIKPVIDRVFPLEKMAEAHDYVELGHKRGNVIISVSL